MPFKPAPHDFETELQTLRLRLLGGFAVSLGQHTVAENQWRLRKSKSLIKLLALAPQHRLHREQLIDILWGDLAPQEAGHNLHQALYVARRALGAANKTSVFLQLQDEVLRLGPEHLLEIDVDAFESAAKKARAERSPTAYEHALNLYGGDLLPEDRYDDWVAARRETLAKDYVRLLSDLSALYEAQHAYAAGIDPAIRILQSDPANEDAHRRLMRLYALSGQRQQALRQYDALCDALRREMDVEPQSETKHLYGQILTGQFNGNRTADKLVQRATAAPTVAATNDAVPTNLPIPVTSFVGRERELAELQSLMLSRLPSRTLQTGARARLLTLTGAGGTGKTRLALELAASLGRDAASAQLFTDGIWLVEIAPLSDPALVPQAVANVLGVHEASGRPLKIILGDWLRSKRLLLILDNCEHLIDACAQFADLVLRVSARTQILATSREPLGIDGETMYRVPSLPAPNPAEVGVDARTAPRGQGQALPLQTYAAVQLFVERAQSANTGFVLDAANAPAVAQVCARLDGIPLAIELAAARVRGLSVEQIAARLDDSFHLLTSGSRTALPRHRTLRALIDWSYDLLSAQEQLLLQRLSVFVGGWTLEAAESVGAREGIAQHEVMELLLRLQDKSLVVAETRDTDVRFRLFETVRQYVLEKCLESGQADSVAERHLVFFLQLAETTAPLFRGKERMAAMQRLNGDLDNFRAAMTLAIERDRIAGMNLVGDLYWFWYFGGHIREAYSWSERVLASSCKLLRHSSLASDDNLSERKQCEAEAKALYTSGMFAFFLGDYVLAQSRLEAAEVMAQRANSSDLQADVLAYLCNLKIYQGETTAASAYIEKSAKLFRAVGDTWGLAFSLFFTGELNASVYPEIARKAYKESLSLYRRLEDDFFASVPLTSLAHMASEQGDFAAAREMLMESVLTRRKYSDKYQLSIALMSLAEVMCQQHDYTGAASRCEEALSLSRELQNRSGIAWSLRVRSDIEAGFGNLQGAEQLLQESLTIYQELGQIGDATLVREKLARIAGLQATC